jgi:hypothetical protein
VTLDELLRTEVEGKARPVTHEEARAVLENGPERFSPDQSGETLLADIMDRMLENRTAQPRKELSREMRSRHTVKLLLEQPRISVRANDGPARGPEKASVTMVVFTDFQCPYSARVSPTLQSLREKYGDHIRLVFRHSPLPFHKDAARAAVAAACADEQSRFWGMHYTLFANQSALSEADVSRHVRTLGMDTDRFRDCVASGRLNGPERLEAPRPAPSRPAGSRLRT